MSDLIEIPERPIEDGKNRFVKKLPYRERKTILSGAKPREGSALAGVFRRQRKKRESYGTTHASSDFIIKPYKGSMSRSEFVEAYVKALSKRPDIIPNIFCSRSYLLAHKELIPAIDKFGYMSFCTYTFNHFYLPAYKWMDNEKVFFKPKESYYTFPMALAPAKGLRLDVQYMFTRDVSVYMIPKALKIRNTMRNVPYNTYTIPYDSTEYDDKLNHFVQEYLKRVRQRVMTEDFDGFVNMLFNDYGQHRYVIEKADTGNIMAVLIWEDTGDMIDMLYTVGYVEDAKDYGYEQEDWKKFREEKCLRYPETILRYEFMKRFPKGTIFNGGGCGTSHAMRWMQQISQPSHIFELRTCRNIRCDKRKGELIKPVGRLPFEYYMPTKSKTWWVDCVNRVLFDKSQKKRIKLYLTEEQLEQDRKHRRRQAARFLRLKELGEKNLKKLQNSS